jgi:hypothetical protein
MIPSDGRVDNPGAMTFTGILVWDGSIGLVHVVQAVRYFLWVWRRCLHCYPRDVHILHVFNADSLRMDVLMQERALYFSALFLARPKHYTSPTA